MIGISKTKHEHLNNALLVLEKILQNRQHTLPFELIQLIETKERLNVIFQEYELLLEKLNYQSKYYNELAYNVRTGLLNKTLKSLKVQLPVESLEYQHLKDSMQLVKGI